MERGAIGEMDGSSEQGLKKWNAKVTHPQR